MDTSTPHRQNRLVDDGVGSGGLGVGEWGWVGVGVKAGGRSYGHDLRVAAAELCGSKAHVCRAVVSTENQLLICNVHVCGAIEAQDHS